MSAPTLRMQYRAARTLALYDARRERLRDRAAEARATLKTAAALSAPALVPGGVRIDLPGYRVTIDDRGPITVEPNHAPVPYDWTQTTIDDYLEADA